MHPIYDHDRIPPMVRQTLDDYGKHGLQPGAGVRAILAGDLFGAIARVDVDTMAALPAIVTYVERFLPRNSYGTSERVDAWIAERATERAGAAR